jgi:hypothetical protein
MFVVLTDAAEGAVWTDYGMVPRKGDIQFPRLPRLHVEPTTLPVVESVQTLKRTEKSRNKRSEKDVFHHSRAQKVIKVARRSESNFNVISVNLGEYITQVIPEVDTIRTRDMYKGVTKENAWSVPYMKAANQDTCRLPDYLFNFMDSNDFIWQ